MRSRSQRLQRCGAKREALYLVDIEPPLDELSGDGVGGRLGDELVEVGRDVDGLPLLVLEGALADEVRNGVGGVGD